MPRNDLADRAAWDALSAQCSELTTYWRDTANARTYELVAWCILEFDRTPFVTIRDCAPGEAANRNPTWLISLDTLLSDRFAPMTDAAAYLHFRP